MAFPKLEVINWVFLVATSIVLFLLVLACWFLIAPLIPILVIPTLVLGLLRNKIISGEDPYDLSVDRVMRFFAAGWWPSSLLCVLAELGLVIVFAFIFMGDQIRAFISTMQERMRDARQAGETPETGLDDFEWSKNFGYYAFMFCLAFIVAATVEEVGKALVVRCGCCSPPCCRQDATEQSRARVTLILFLAAAAGFSTAENVGYTLNFCEETHSLVWVFILGVVRVLLSLPVHLVCASYTALNYVKRDRLITRGQPVKSQVFALLPAIFIHGLFDFQALVIENTLITLPLGYLILGTASFFWWREWKKETGPSNAFDHQTLPDDNSGMAMGVIVSDGRDPAAAQPAQHVLPIGSQVPPPQAPMQHGATIATVPAQYRDMAAPQLQTRAADPPRSAGQVV